MRVGIVRTDLGDGVWIGDLHQNHQRSFVSSPPGQARTIRRPTDAEFDTALEAFPSPLVLLGAEQSATVDTSTNDTLRIRTNAQQAYTVIAVTQNVALAKTDIRDELNVAFLAAGLPFVAAIAGTNQIELTTTGTNVGPLAGLDIDTFANGSLLNTPVGFADGATLTGTATATDRVAVQAAVYPTGVTIDVSEATIIAAIAEAANLSAADQTALATAVANVVAPLLTETGKVLLSFERGVLSELVDTTFQPGGVRAGLPVGVAAAIVENDGVTVFSLA